MEVLTTSIALPTTKQVQLVNPKKFVIAALDTNINTFVVHMAIREQKEMVMDPDIKAQIKTQIEAQSETQSRASSEVQVRALIFNEVFTKVLAEYFDYSNVFSAKNTAELPKTTGMNEHAIKLEKNKQLFFEPIYSLAPVELEILKIYIKTYLVNGFIQPSKSPAGAPILFNRKLDRNFHFCVDYQGLNNIIIKNWYPLPLIRKSLNKLGRTK